MKPNDVNKFLVVFGGAFNLCKGADGTFWIEPENEPDQIGYRSQSIRNSCFWRYYFKDHFSKEVSVWERFLYFRDNRDPMGLSIAKIDHCRRSLALSTQNGYEVAVRRQLAEGVMPTLELLGSAAWRGYANIVRLFVEGGVNPKEPHHYRDSPIIRAIEHRRCDVVDYLLSHVIPPNAAVFEVALKHLCNANYDPAQESSAKICAMLLRKERSLAYVEFDGETALHLLFKEKSPVLRPKLNQRVYALALQLMQAGTELNIKNLAGNTALDIALKQKDWEAARFLRSQGADWDQLETPPEKLEQLLPPLKSRKRRYASAVEGGPSKKRRLSLAS